MPPTAARENARETISRNTHPQERPSPCFWRHATCVLKFICKHDSKCFLLNFHPIHFCFFDFEVKNLLARTTTDANWRTLIDVLDEHNLFLKMSSWQFLKNVFCQSQGENRKQIRWFLEGHVVTIVIEIAEPFEINFEERRSRLD